MDPATLALVISAGEALATYAQGVYERWQANKAAISASDQAGLTQRLMALNSALSAKITADENQLLSDLPPAAGTKPA